MTQMGAGPQSFGQSPANMYAGQDRAGTVTGGTVGLPPFIAQNDLAQRRQTQFPPDLSSGSSTAQMGMHERGLPPFPGQEQLGLGGMGGRGLDSLGGIDSRLMQERGFPPKSDHLVPGAYEVYLFYSKSC